MRAQLAPINIIVILLILGSCGSKEQNSSQTIQNNQVQGAKVQGAKVQGAKVQGAKVQDADVQTYDLIKRFPHDTTAFTQGLLIEGGVFFESTGLNGRSSIRKVDVLTGKVLLRKGVDSRYFAEGLAMVGNELYQITWLNQKGFVYNKSLELVREFSYVGEGWGLTSDGTMLYKSNGTDVITIHDAKTFGQVRAISVTLNGKPSARLNELEWVEGEIWANIWQTEQIQRIDPNTGVVKGVIDCTNILKEEEKGRFTDVMNGIAYDPKSKTVYVTGKNWPWVYQIKVK